MLPAPGVPGSGPLDDAQKLLGWLNDENDKLAAKIGAGKETGVAPSAADLASTQVESAHSALTVALQELVW